MARKRIVCIKRGRKHEDPYRHISQVGIGGGAGFSEVLLVEEVTQQLQSPTGDRFYVHGSDGREAAGEAGAAAGVHAFSRALGELAEGVIAPSQWEPGVDFSDVHGPLPRLPELPAELGLRARIHRRGKLRHGPGICGMRAQDRHLGGRSLTAGRCRTRLQHFSWKFPSRPGHRPPGRTPHPADPMATGQ